MIPLLRIEAILRDPCYREYIDKNLIKEKDRRFCRHTFQHLLDVARITYILMLETGDIHRFMEANDLNLRTAKELVYASALLHDIGRWKEYDTGEDHSKVSAELAVSILETAGFSESEIKLVCDGISEHRRLSENPSLLGERLFRADNLSRICLQCEARNECYKIDQMETGHSFLIY